MTDDVHSSPNKRPVMRPSQNAPCSPGRRQDYNSSSSAMFSTSVPLAIRGAPMDVIPPPLPPPRHVVVHSNSKPIWQPYNQPLASGSVSPGSSLNGNWRSHNLPVARKPGVPLLNSPLREGLSSSVIEDDRELLPGIASFQARPLDTQNQNRSTEAYDKHQLSKLGRPKTPVRSGAQGSIDSSPVAGNRLRLDTQNSLHRLTLADRSLGGPDSPFKDSPSAGRWGQLQQHPNSGTISPGMMSSAASTRSTNLSELRSPTYDPSTAPSSFVTDNHVFSRVGSVDRTSNASLSLLSSAFDENEREMKNRFSHVITDRAVAEYGRSNRASFDQGIFMGDSEVDSDFTGQPPSAPPLAGLRSQVHNPREYASSRQLSLDGSMAADATTVARHGTKRKAPPADVTIEEPAAQAARSHTPSRSVKRASPAHQSSISQASLSSLSSPSAHNTSYRSASMSVAPSTVTSVSSQDQLAPAVPVPVKQEGRQAQTHSSYGHSLTQLAAQAQTSAALQQEAVSGGAAGDTNAATAAIKPPLANIHMCNCCPKKPKKFPTLEALHAHQNEKQYYCNYCHNRFKNKNEAERHQNSLHLRKQSWSCATLENRYERAFHPCNAVAPTTGTHAISPGQSAGAEYDVCGYCGKQFSNYPSPDWLDRSKHLTETHKFGECNQSKKFFRADHFRQHLKHSHGGVAGKWTNMLESACLRDEPPPQPIENPSQEQLRQQQQQQQQSQRQASQALHATQQQTQTIGQPPIPAYQLDSLQSAVSPKSAPGPQPNVGQPRPSGYAAYPTHHPA